MPVDYLSDYAQIRDRIEKSHDPSCAIRHELVEAEKRFFFANLKTADVLVAGCGLGHDSMYMAPHNYMVTGVDIVEPFVREAQARIAGKNVNIQYLVADFFGLPFPDGSFDAAVMNMGTIGNLGESEKAIVELLRVAPIVHADFYLTGEHAMEKRLRMYWEEGWHNPRQDFDTIVSDDGLDSRALHYDSVRAMCPKDATITIAPLTDFAAMATFVRC